MNETIEFDHPARSSNIRYNPALDHIRFFAAFLVFCFHFFTSYAGFGASVPDPFYLRLITNGYTGVTLFFVLSGFLFMTIALGADRIDYRRFMMNRFLRIYPLFLFMFFVAISIGSARFVPTDVFALLFSNLGHPPTSATVLTGAAWTISIEFTFYTIFPFLARFAKAQGPAYLLRAIAVMLVIRLAAYAVAEQPTLVFYWTMVGRLDQLLIGMLAAQLWSRVAPRPILARVLARILLALGAVSIFCLVGLQGGHARFQPPYPHPEVWIFWGPVEAVGWSLCVVGYAGAAIRLPAPLSRWLGRGGELSYSFYLMHLVVITMLLRYVGPLAMGWGNAALLLCNGALAFGLTWALSALMFRVIEQPFLGMRRRYVGEPPHE